MFLQPLHTTYESLIEAKENLTLDDYFEQIKALIIQAIKENDIEYVQKLMEDHLMPLVISSRNNEIFYLLKELEQYFTQQAKQLLALYYRILGHTLYFRFEYEKANSYYKLAISHSLENKDYIGVATAMNNFMLKGFHSLSEDVGLNIAKSIPLILKIDNNYTIIDLISKLYFYMEFAIIQGKGHYIERLLNSIVEGDYVKGHERYELQLKMLQSIFLKSKGELQKAKALYVEVLQHCVEKKSHHDILLHVYKELVNLKLPTDDIQLEQSVHETVSQLERSLKEERQLMLKYLEKEHSLKPLKYSSLFGLRPEKFKYVATLHLQNFENDGTTLLLIDCILTTHDTGELLKVLSLLNDEMHLEFGENILVETIIDNSTLAYILPLSELEVDSRIYNAFNQVRKHYPKESSILKGMYFASVNNKENNLFTVEDCLNLAYAYIYYELQ